MTAGLAVELPQSGFLSLSDPRGEIRPMSSPKRAFVEAAIAKCGISTDVFFGIADLTESGVRMVGTRGRLYDGRSCLLPPASVSSGDHQSRSMAVSCVQPELA